MNDSNHMDVVPRIVDNSMKITKEQLKSDKKKNENFNFRNKNIQTTPPANIAFNAPSLINKIPTSFQNINYNYVIIFAVVILVIIIIYVLYLYYKEKKAKKKANVDIKQELSISDVVENYDEYIQEDDDLESLTSKSNVSSKQDKDSETKLAHETILEVDNEVESNIDVEDIEEDSEDIKIFEEIYDDADDIKEIGDSNSIKDADESSDDKEDDNKDNMNIIDKLQYDLRN